MADDPGKLQVAASLTSIRKLAREKPLILVFGLGSFGDVIQITPLLRALRERFEKAHLVLVHHDRSGAKLFTPGQEIDDYLRLPSGYHYLLRSKLADGDYDLTVECRYAVKYTLSPTARFNAEDLSFLEHSQAAQKPWLPLIQNFPFDNDELWRAAHARGWNMYELMAQTSGFAGQDFEAMAIQPQGVDVAAKFNLPARYLVISNAAEFLSVQSAMWTKCLPHEKMAAIVREFRKGGIPTVLLGTSNDPGRYDVDLDLRGRTTLLEGAGIVRSAKLLLGPEGGLVNLARALEVPSVVFFGSTPPEFFALKANVNLAPAQCGGCWWSTESYLRQCPLLENTPPCTKSHDAERIVRAVFKQFFR